VEGVLPLLVEPFLPGLLDRGEDLGSMAVVDDWAAQVVPSAADLAAVELAAVAEVAVRKAQIVAEVEVHKILVAEAAEHRVQAAVEAVAGATSVD